jgi:amidase
VDKRVLQTLEKGRAVLEAIGCEVSEGFPDFSGADDIFKTWRAWLFEMKHGETIKSKREQMKSTVIWNIEAGQQLTGPELGRMELRRTALYHRVREFMETHEFLCLPVAQVPPFPVEQEYITEINGTPMETYLDWMRSCYFITVTGLPAISVPCGFTEDGLPIGLQIVGRSRDELGVLQLAHAFQQANPAWQQVPEVAQPN